MGRLTKPASIELEFLINIIANNKHFTYVDTISGVSNL